MKKVIFIILLFALCSCETDNKLALDLVNYVPQNAGIIIKIPQLDALINNIEQNEFLSSNPSFPLYTQTSKKLAFLQFLKSKNPALLTFTNEGKDEVAFSFIIKDNPNLLSAMGKKTVKDSISYEGYYIKTSIHNNQRNYFTSIDSIFVLSDSKLILENIIRQKDFPVAEDLIKAYQVSSNKNVSVIINHNSAEEIVSSLLPNKDFINLKKFSGWTSADMEITKTGLNLNGITTAPGPQPQLLNIFNKVPAAPNEIAQVAPINAHSLYSFTFRDFSILKNNIEQYHTNRETKKAENESFFTLCQEMGVISFKDEKALVVNTSSIIEAREAMASENEVVKTFREVAIYNFSNGNLFRETFNPLINLTQLNYYTVLDHFLIFAEEIETLEHITANFQNETVLSKQAFYQQLMSGLSTEASILLLSLNKNNKENFSQIVASEDRASIKGLNFNDYPIAAVQFIYDKDFAHLHASFEKNTAVNSQEGTVTQIASASLENNVATPPSLFTNHLNNQQEVVVQDEKNQLYLISNTGKILWKKKLDGPILGKVQQVDLYKNNKFQLAFTTPTKFYILDRLGNEVKPFPINFKNKVTQALGVFDYDNNRNYRFVIVQDENLLMYDANGKVVNGFQFKRANGEITNTPKHIRIGTKDYILIPDEGGKLHIIDRQGNPRIKVTEKINFSGNDWYLHKNSFASTNAEGDLLLINEKGELKKEKKNLKNAHGIDATANTFVSVSENELRINDKKIELDFGLYSKPQIFYVNDKIYVAVTDLQAHKVFIYDSKGEMLPNFPVYGNSPISLANMDSDKNPEFVVQGEDNSLLIYEIN